MRQSFPSRIGRLAAVAVLLACISGAGGDTGAAAGHALGRTLRHPVRGQAVVAPLVLDHLAFMECRDRHGLAAYLWCGSGSIGAAGSDWNERFHRLATAGSLPDESTPEP